LPLLPTVKTERVIAEVVSEIAGLLQNLHQVAMNDQAAWLIGFAVQLAPDAWPPQSQKGWHDITTALIKKKRLLSKGARKRQRLSPRQLSAIWATINNPAVPHVDRDLVYLIIEKQFPKARREGRASLSSLTKHEAGLLLDQIRA
jgi:hypothetical protein